MLLYEKYSPKDIGDLLITREAKAKLHDFAVAASEGKKPAPLLMYGPSGTGKSAAVHTIAESHGFKLIEFNASDYRDAETLRKKLLPTTTTRSLFNEKLLILFDEVDELSSRFDSGAESIILTIVKKSRYPVVLIANDYWDRKISFLRNQTDRLEFKRIKADELSRYLSFVAQAEGSTLGKETIGEIASRANGDIRGALNDLEALMQGGPELMEYIGVRNRKSEVFKLLDKIFLSGNFDMARNATFSTDLSLDMILNWVDQNIPSKYLSKKGVQDAYEQLSRASMFLERASRDNYYEYWKYASVIMSSGVSISGGGVISTLNPYTFPAKISHMSRTKKERNQLNEIALKLSSVTHTSRKQILNSYLPLLKKIVNGYNIESGDELALENIGRGVGLEGEDMQTVLEYYRLK